MEASKKFKPPVSEFPDDEPEVKSTVVALVPEVRRQAMTVPAKAMAIEVKDQPGLTLANDFLQDIKRIGAQICATFDPQAEQAHKLHKSLLAEKKKFMAPLELAESIIKPKIAEYLTAQEKIRREAERKRCEAEEEALRQTEKALARAKTFEARGETEKADALIEKTHEKVGAMMDAAPIVPEAPKTNGLTMRDVWKFVIDNEDQIPREYMVPDLVKIGKYVRALGNDAKIPGVRVYSEKVVAQRSEI
jgi:hypothetical protein